MCSGSFVEKKEKAIYANLRENKKYLFKSESRMSIFEVHFSLLYGDFIAYLE